MKIVCRGILFIQILFILHCTSIVDRQKGNPIINFQWAVTYTRTNYTRQIDDLCNETTELSISLQTGDVIDFFFTGINKSTYIYLLYFSVDDTFMLLYPGKEDRQRKKRNFNKKYRLVNKGPEHFIILASAKPLSTLGKKINAYKNAHNPPQRKNAIIKMRNEIDRLLLINSPFQADITEIINEPHFGGTNKGDDEIKLIVVKDTGFYAKKISISH